MINRGNETLHERLLCAAERRAESGQVEAAASLRARASIVAYHERQAAKLEASGQRGEATAIRAIASSIAAGLDVSAGRRGVACPVTAIIREVAPRFIGASFAEIVAPSRGSLVTIRARFAAMWVAKKRLGWSDERLEPGFRRERSTITHGVERAEQLRAEDDGFREITEHLVELEIRCEHCDAALVPA